MDVEDEADDQDSVKARDRKLSHKSSDGSIDSAGAPEAKRKYIMYFLKREGNHNGSFEIKISS